MKTIRPIIFCRIATMKHYRGVTEDDIPFGGGSYVDDYHDGGEVYNFAPVRLDGKKVCLGFVQLTNCIDRKSPTLHIERIINCGDFSKSDSVDDVLVVFCTRGFEGSGELRVCGWYDGATAYRHHRYTDFDNGDNQEFNFIAPASKCVLLPFNDRYKKDKWIVPMSRKKGFGFGQGNVWFCNQVNENPNAREFVANMIHSIESYSGGRR